MRIVQYAAGDTTGCGVEVEGQVFATPYPDTLALVRDGERGLEQAAAASGSGDPVAVDRILAPLTNPGKIFGSGINYASHKTENPAAVFPTEPGLKQNPGLAFAVGSGRLIHGGLPFIPVAIGVAP